MAPTTVSDATTTDAQETLQALLREVDVQINGDRPWDPQVHDDRLYRRALSGGSLAAGEAYMDGWWDCEALDQLFYRILRARLDQEFGWSWRQLWNVVKAFVLNLQNSSRAYEVGEEHYDRGNDLFQRMLDDRMVYSCGYWRRAETLDEAQEAKLDLICRKLRLEPGMRVLDIGCGWGSFAQYAAEEYGVEVVGVTISEEQVDLARERCADLPVEIRLQDYREVEASFDRVVSIGMFEHVGHKNHRTYMETVRRCLREGGLSMLHTIGNAESSPVTDPWIEKYIFPNGLIPSTRQIARAAEDLFVIEDWHNFGPDYDRTLMAWAENFESSWDALSERYSDRFYRMWRYYLYQCAGAFRARRNQLWQIVLSPEGVEDRYVSVR
ncbi:MAG: cyclopropane fatty acyl phospholipid synthase [Salinibacter sp.]|uniref:cyclopropane fatty acyl phospholipid synthase n=1 Tax=Salinibacter sp. TaxID=2065818 RepID=UPI0035D4C584